MKLLKSISGITLANMLSVGIPFLLMPILTNYLTTTEYGQLDIFTTTMSFLFPLIGLSFYSGITVFFHNKEIDNAKYIGTSLSLSILMGIGMLILTGVIYLFSPLLFFKYYIPFIVLFALFKVINETISTYWLLSENVLFFGVFKVSRTLLELLLSILFVVLFLWGLKGRILAIGIIGLIANLLVISIFIKKYKVRLAIDKKLLKIGLAYSLPLIFHSIGGYILNISDRYFIDGMVSTAELGIYSVAYQIGMSFHILQISFNQAWVPYFMRIISNENFDKIKMVRQTYILSLVSIIVFFILWFLVPVFYYFVGKEFQSGQDIVIWVLLGFLFNGFYLMVVNYIFYLKKTSIIATTTIVVGIINLILNYYLIPIYGIKGAAISTAISFFMSFVFFWWISNKYYPMPWFSNEIIKKK